MKKVFLKISNPCSENWNNMKPKENGNYCTLCSKTVIDFSQLSQSEIVATMTKVKGNICAKVTQHQLSTPIFIFESPQRHSLPFSNVTAGLILATALVGSPQLHADNKVQTEVVQTEISSGNIYNNERETPPNKTEPNKTTLFTGIITSKDKNEPVENAKVTFVTLRKVFTAYTLKDGTFSMVIPTNLIDSDNVVRVNYEQIKSPAKTEKFLGFESKDLILSKKDMASIYQIKAGPIVFYLGGASLNISDPKPNVVFYNGKEILDYDFSRIYTKYIKDRKENINLYSFNSETAKALYHSEDIESLYIIIDAGE